MSSPARKSQYLAYMMLYGLLAFVIPVWADSISGTYVGKASNAAFLIQVVKTSDGHLTGRYEEVDLRPDGKLDNLSDTIEGATDGHTFAAKIGSILGMAVSGTIEGATLNLNGGSNFRRTLVKSGEDEFRTHVAFLTNQSNQINTANAQRDEARRRALFEAARVSKLQSLTQQMSDFTSSAEASLERAKHAEDRYRAITGKMHDSLAKEREISGNDTQSYVRRNNIAISIDHAGIDADHIHIEVGWSANSFDSGSKQLQTSSAEASKACGRPGAGLSGPTPSGRPDWWAACDRFTAAANKFGPRMAAVRAGYINLERTWKKEREEQKSIMQTAQASVRL
ncbi:MAG: hypothetical protein NVSMB6_21020 [Burkholderiaceae bacterium]